MSQESLDMFLQQEEEVIRLNHWIFDNIQSYIKPRILVLNSGSGMFPSLLLEQNIPLHLSDPNKINRDKLREKFIGSPTLKFVISIDPRRKDFEQRYSSSLGSFSTLILLNISEYGFPEKVELKNASLLLRNGGHIITCLPSCTVSFPGGEPDLEALKINNQKSIKLLLGSYRILKTRYFNLERGPDIPAANHQTVLSVVVVAAKDQACENLY